MKQDEEGIVIGAVLDRAHGEEAPRVAAGVGELGQPLQCDQRDDHLGKAHAALRAGSAAAARAASTRRKPAVKPGPSEVSSERRGSPARVMARSNTNSTVAADMLPYSRSTSRE